MKKIFTLVLAAAATLGVTAQRAVESHKFFDNWSLGVYGGAVTPLQDFGLDRSRAVAGLELSKQLTPVIGVGVQAGTGFTPTGSHTVADNVTAMLIGKANLSNLFCGYKGTPRLFEIEALAGAGMNHFFGCGAEYAIAAEDATSFATKAGLNFNFNLGSAKAWTIGIRPAVVWDMEGGRKMNDQVKFNANNAVLELTAGITYHFKSSNGKNHFTTVKAYDAAQIDALNAKINDLRNNLNAKDADLKAKDQAIRDLQQALNDCRNQKPVVERVVDTKQTMESVVTFRQGKSVVDASQLPNVERIATYLKNHKDAKVIIKGYASPEGSAEINAKIANARAVAVRDILVNKYKIAANRISAEGQGVGNMFSEPDWNRVSICTLDESK